MRILLDTHVYLWWLQNSKQLSKAGRATIISASEIYVSSASIWEATIKVSIGKLAADVSSLIDEISNNGFHELPVTAKHAARISLLPSIHRDPFDRILVAQALCEPLRFLTSNKILAGYTELVDVI